MDILKVENLKKYYGQDDNLIKALDGVDLYVKQGEFVAITGASGSGKTTLLNMIGGLDIPTSGKIYYKGKEIEEKNSDELTIYRRRNIGFIFQNYNLVPVLNVLENITLPIELDARNPDKEFVQEVVNLLGLKEKIYKMPNQLSGGEQQRVAIARGIASKPQIILADEPTGNLDSKTGEEVIKLLQETSRKYHQTIVMITHDSRIAAKAERVIEMVDGKVERQEKFFENY